MNRIQYVCQRAPYQQVKGDEDGTGGEADLGPGGGEFPHQEDEKRHIWHQQQKVPETHPNV